MATDFIVSYYLRGIKDLTPEEYETTYLYKLGVEYRIASALLYNLVMDFDQYCKKSEAITTRETAVYVVNNVLLPFQNACILYAVLPRNSQQAKIVENTRLIPLIEETEKYRRY